jgi:hypothetical protein
MYVCYICMVFYFSACCGVFMYVIQKTIQNVVLAYPHHVAWVRHVTCNLLLGPWMCANIETSPTKAKDTAYPSGCDGRRPPPTLTCNMCVCVCVYVRCDQKRRNMYRHVCIRVHVHISVRETDEHTKEATSERHICT